MAQFNVSVLFPAEGQIMDDVLENRFLIVKIASSAGRVDQ